MFREYRMRIYPFCQPQEWMSQSVKLSRNVNLVLLGLFLSFLFLPLLPFSIFICHHSHNCSSAFFHLSWPVGTRESLCFYYNTSSANYDSIPAIPDLLKLASRATRSQMPPEPMWRSLPLSTSLPWDARGQTTVLMGLKKKKREKDLSIYSEQFRSLYAWVSICPIP